MKIISLFVSSLDGRITKEEKVPTKLWTSTEDQEFFKRTLQESNLIVMGSGTFTPAYAISRNGQLRIIVTKNPEKYRQYAIPEQVEFTAEDPQQLVSRLRKKGFEQMLLIGGPKITTAFFKEELIHELWITIEPRIFGKGLSLVEERKMDVQLQLFETKQLNKQGTILLKYKIIKASK